MKKRRVLYALLTAAVFVVSGFAAFFGLFNRVQVEEKSDGPFTLVYQEYTGDYSGVAPRIEEVRGYLEKNLEIYCVRGFAIFYDDPSVPPERRRSICGCILDIDDDEIRSTILKTYKIKEIDERVFMTVVFPARGAFSYMIGPMKVYPAFGRYAREHEIKGGPGMEIYESDRITYLMPLVPGNM